MCPNSMNFTLALPSGQDYLAYHMLGELEDSTIQCMVQRRGGILFNTASVVSFEEEDIAPLFLRVRTMLEVPYDSGLAPKCNKYLSLRLQFEQV